MNLEEQTDRRLILAGVGYDDPGLAQIRAWNASVYARAGRGNDGRTTGRVDRGRGAHSRGDRPGGPVAARQAASEPGAPAELERWRRRYHPAPVSNTKTTK